MIWILLTLLVFVAAMVVITAPLEVKRPLGGPQL